LAGDVRRGILSHLTVLHSFFTRASLEATPAEVAPVDWEHYRKVIKTPGIVDAVQQKVRSAGGRPCGVSKLRELISHSTLPELQQYEAIKFQYPEDKLSTSIEEARKSAVRL
jgi:hypothetical protein